MEPKNREKTKKDNLPINENNQKETTEFHGEKYKKNQNIRIFYSNYIKY